MNNEIRYTDEEMQKLKECEKHFKTVTGSQFLRCTPTAMNNMVRDILAAHNVTKFNCKVCRKVIYDMYNYAGKIYLNQLKEQEQITAELTEPIIIEQSKEKQTEKVDLTKSKKKGRPKKQRKEK